MASDAFNSPVKTQLNPALAVPATTKLHIRKGNVKKPSSAVKNSTMSSRVSRDKYSFDKL